MRRDSGRYSVTHAPCVPRARGETLDQRRKKRSPVWVAVPSTIERSAALSSKPWSGGRVSCMAAGPAVRAAAASIRSAGDPEAMGAPWPVLRYPISATAAERPLPHRKLPKLDVAGSTRSPAPLSPACSAPCSSPCSRPSRHRRCLWVVAYFDHYHRWRCHQSLAMDCPEPRPVQPPEQGDVVEVARRLYRTRASRRLLGALPRNTHVAPDHTRSRPTAEPRPDGAKRTRRAERRCVPHRFAATSRHDLHDRRVPPSERVRAWVFGMDNPERTIRPAERGSLRLASQDDQLLSQGQVLQRQRASGFEARPRRREHGQHERSHGSRSLRPAPETSRILGQHGVLRTHRRSDHCLAPPRRFRFSRRTPAGRRPRIPIGSILAGMIAATSSRRTHPRCASIDFSFRTISLRTPIEL